MQILISILVLGFIGSVIFYVYGEKIIEKFKKNKNIELAVISDDGIEYFTGGCKFQIKKDKKNQFRFNFIAKNGEIIVSSEGYKTKQSAKKAIELIRETAKYAEVIEL